MSMPKRGHVRLVVYVSPEVKASLREESKSRRIPMGDLIEEALASRVVMVRKK